MKSHSCPLPELRYIVVPQISPSMTRQGPITEHESHMLDRGFPCQGNRPACSAIQLFWALAEAGRPHQGLALISSILESPATQNHFSALELFLIDILARRHSVSGRPTETEITWDSLANIGQLRNNHLVRFLRNEVTENGPNYVVLNNLACLSYLTGPKMRAWRTFCWAYEMSLSDRLVGLNLAKVSFEVNHSNLGTTILESHHWRYP
jgi:hypothetical protein